MSDDLDRYKKTLRSIAANAPASVDTDSMDAMRTVARTFNDIISDARLALKNPSESKAHKRHRKTVAALEKMRAESLCLDCGGSGSIRIHSHEDYGGSFECDECETCAGTGDLKKAPAQVLEDAYRELMSDGGGFDAESVLDITDTRGWYLTRKQWTPVEDEINEVESAMFLTSPDGRVWVSVEDFSRILHERNEALAQVESWQILAHRALDRQERLAVALEEATGREVKPTEAFANHMAKWAAKERAEKWGWALGSEGGWINYLEVGASLPVRLEDY